MVILVSTTVLSPPTSWSSCLPTHRAVPTWTELICHLTAAGAVADAEVRAPTVDSWRGVWVRK